LVVPSKEWVHLSEGNVIVTAPSTPEPGTTSPGSHYAAARRPERVAEAGTSTVRSGGFSASLEFLGDRAVIGLRRVLDDLALPGLEALLDSVIVSEYEFVVVDLADLDHMAAEGLAVIVAADQRMTGLERRLAVRSPSAAVRHLLDTHGLEGLARTLPSEMADAPLGPAQLADSWRGAVPSESRDLLHDLRGVIAASSNDDVVDGSLRLVVALARATVGGADGVSVSLRRDGRLATVAASDQTISDMDASQYATSEGPCVDASIEGRWFHVESLDTELRWPSFIPQAKALGINAILSSPLTSAGEPVGSINIYSRTVSAFEPEDQRLASVFAHEASAILTGSGMDLTDEERSARVQDALLTREVIAQAQGVLMERDGITEDAAYTALRVHSQQTGQPLHRRAQDISASTRRTPTRPDEPDLGRRGDHGD
jgi:anti-anti-sigma factor